MDTDLMTQNINIFDEALQDCQNTASGYQGAQDTHRIATEGDSSMAFQTASGTWLDDYYNLTGDLKHMAELTGGAHQANLTLEDQNTSMAQTLRG
jgi:hypothetical protein